MTQVLDHNYGKGRVTRRQIRAAVRFVLASKASVGEAAKKPAAKKVARKASAARSRKSA